jgi:membrane protein
MAEITYQNQPLQIEEVPDQNTPSSPGWKVKLKNWFLGTLTWKELVSNVWKEMNEDDVFGIAAQLAYYFLFALFPLLLFLVTLIGFLPVQNLYAELSSFISQVLPGEAVALVQGNIDSIAKEQRGGLLSIGLLATLWAASRAVSNLSAALNKAYDVEEKRPWWKIQAMSLGLTVSLSLFAIVSVILMIFGGQIGEWVANAMGLGFLFQVAWNVIRLFVAALIMMGIMAILYYFGPDVEQKWRWVTPGAVVAVIGWIGASLAFAYYVNHFGAYNKTYGTIGAVIILLTWMYLTGLMILVGGEINSVIEQSLPEGKNAGEKRLAENHPYNLTLKARNRLPKGKVRRWLFSPWSLAGLGAFSAVAFYFTKRHRSDSPEA